ncbi:AtzG-like protein [Roseomonas sp. F4]
MTPADLESHIRSAAALLDLPIAPTHLPGMVATWQVAAAAAAQIAQVPLTAEDEPAPVFRATP